MSQKSNPEKNIGNEIKKAIRHLRESKGSSFADIKKYLSFVYQTKGMNKPDSTSLKIYLKNAVDKGTFLKLENGNYKIKENARRKKSNRSCSRDNKPSKRSTSKKSSGEIRRSVSGIKKPGRPRSTKETSGSEKMNLRKKSKRKSAQSPMPIKKKQATSTKNRAETPKKGVKRKTKENTSISDYNDEPGYEDSDIEDRKELSDEMPHSLSESKKRGRPSNAKQDMGSEKINLPKNKREPSPSPMPVKKKQTSPTTKRAVTPNEIDKQKTKEDTSRSDYRDELGHEDCEIEDQKELSDEIPHSPSGSEKRRRPSNAKQDMGSEKINLPKTNRKTSPSSKPLKKKQEPQVEKSTVTPKKLGKRKIKEGTSICEFSEEPNYQSIDIESRKKFSGEMSPYLSDSKKTGQPRSTKQAMESEKLNLPKTKRNISETKRNSIFNADPEETDPIGQEKSCNMKKVNKRKKEKALSLSDYSDGPDYEDSDFESRKKFSGKVRFSLSGSEKSGRPNNPNQVTRSEKLYLRNNKRKRSSSSIPVKRKQTPAAKKRSSTPKKVDKRKKKKGSRSV